MQTDTPRCQDQIHSLIPKVLGSICCPGARIVLAPFSPLSDWFSSCCQVLPSPSSPCFCICARHLEKLGLNVFIYTWQDRNTDITPSGKS